MQAETLKKLLLDDIESARASYVKDLEALSEAALSASPGGNARSPYDFTYEVVIVNGRIATRMKGETPGPWPFETWAVAPAEFKNKETAISEFNASVQAVVEAVGDDVTREVPSGDGVASVYSLGKFCPMHVMYHDAQLNYVQAMQGDAEMHW